MARKSETPVMQQWREAKRKFSDAIVLVRIGEFLEAFHQDAEDCARVLDIALTYRNNGSAAAVPLAGFPIKARDEHIRKLVQAGRRVAILDQVEDPSQAKGVVRREVVDVITPGVVLEDSILAGKKNNFLAAVLVEDSTRTAFVAIDVSTGEVIACAAHTRQIEALLARFEPSEILFPAGNDGIALLRGSGVPATSREPWTFGLDVAQLEICDAYGISHVDGLGFDSKDTLLVRALGGLLTYLAEVRPTGIPQLRRPRIDRGGAVMWLDKMTAQNLELVQPIRSDASAEKGTLIAVLDKTLTPMGGRLLRRWILEPLVDAEEINARLDAVETFTQNVGGRGRLRRLLESVRDLERLGGRVVAGRATPRELRSLADSIGALPQLKEELQYLEGERLSDLCQRLDPLNDLYAELNAALLERPAASTVEGDVIQNGYNDELDELRILRDGSQDRIAAIQERERDRTGIPNLKLGYNRVHGYYIEVTQAHFSKIPEDYQRRQTLANAERYVTPELKDLEEKILGAGAAIEELEQKLFLELRSDVAGKASRILATAESIANIDVLAALAEVADRRGYVRPRIHDSYHLKITAGRHPVVETMLRSDEFIPNDLELDRDSRFTLITGPNMGGKSTVLRQVGLIQLMAQMGSFVPAREAELPVCDRIFTRVGASDDLVAGKSTFMVEMSELSSIVHGATEKSLILLDEVGRGTATNDGLSVAWAVTEHILHEIRAKTLFATHYHELTRLEGDGLANLNVAAYEDNETLVFLHQLRPGPADRSYGIEVGRLAGLPPSIVRRAREILASLDEASETRSLPPPILEDRGEVPSNMSDHPVLARLRSVDTDGLTPLEALLLVVDLKNSI